MLRILKPFPRAAAFVVLCAAVCVAQKMPKTTRIWSVGPLTQSARTMGITLGTKGARLNGPLVSPETGSVFAATRSIAFAGERVVLASMVGLRNIEGAQIPESVYDLISLDARTGEVKDRREVQAFGSVKVFATNEAHVIVSGRSVVRLTPDLKEAGTFDTRDVGNHWRVENISPDGSTLGNATRPGFELIDVRTLQARRLSDKTVSDTSVSSKAAVSDSPLWIRDYPKASSFVTLTDEFGQHLIFHGSCGGRPQFLRDDRILLAACKAARILDLSGATLKTIDSHEPVSFAGVSQNGSRFALQFSGRRERFVIYSVDSAEPIAEVAAEQAPQAQSWTAFSPDGTMIVVGSPQKLTLYRLP